MILVLGIDPRLKLQGHEIRISDVLRFIVSTQEFDTAFEFDRTMGEKQETTSKFHFAMKFVTQLTV